MLKKMFTCLLFVSSTAHAEFCEEAQKIIAQNQEIRTQSSNYSNLDEFLWSKPQFINGKVQVRSYHLPAKSLNTDETIIPDQLWCKMKSAVILTGLDSSTTCADINKATINAALIESGLNSNLADQIIFSKDRSTITGSQWSRGVVEAEYEASSNTVSVQAVALKTWRYVPYLGGMHYCKLLSPTGAKELIDIVAN